MDFDSGMLMWFGCFAITIKIVQTVSETIQIRLSIPCLVIHKDCSDDAEQFFVLSKIVLRCYVSLSEYLRITIRLHWRF